MSLRALKREQQIAAILDAAETLFRRDGFDATTLHEIASLAVASRQTLANYFKTKDVILREVGMRWLQQGINTTQTELEETDSEISGLDRLRHNMSRYAKRIQADREFMALVYMRSGIVFPQSKTPNESERNDLIRRGFEVFATPLRDAQSRGDLRGDIDPLQMAEMLFGIQATTTRLWLMGFWSTGEDLETRLLRAVDVLIKGLKAEQ